jgi:hypothetical protein
VGVGDRPIRSACDDLIHHSASLNTLHLIKKTVNRQGGSGLAGFFY